MNAEDLNDICGRAVRGAPIDADHVLKIIADLTAARAELAEQRRELKATQAGWLVEVNKVARVREYVETEMNFYAHDDNAAYRILRLLGRYES